MQRKNREEQQILCTTSTENKFNDNAIDSDIETYSEDEYIPPPWRLDRNPKQIVLKFDQGTDWIKSVNLVADKNQISSRAQTELLSEVFKAGGADLNDISMSKDTYLR